MFRGSPHFLVFSCFPAGNPVAVLQYTPDRAFRKALQSPQGNELLVSICDKALIFSSQSDIFYGRGIFFEGL